MLKLKMKYLLLDHINKVNSKRMELIGFIWVLSKNSDILNSLISIVLNEKNQME